MPDRRTLDIARLGVHGDGVATTPAGDVYVPGALPGERVVADVEGERGRLVAVERSGGDRVAPPCTHFGTCGACAMQHMAAGPYLAWKREIVAGALAARGLDAAVSPVVATSAASRRRAVLTARRSGGQVLLGFHAARSAEVVDIASCAVLTPRIVAALPGLRALLPPLVSTRSEPRVAVLDAENGLDVTITDIRGAVGTEVKAALAAHAAKLGLARLTVSGDTLLQQAEPVLRLGGIAAVPPPGAFVQASREAEDAMIGIVTAATAKAKRIADLFSGIGTFALPLARGARVLAVDGDKAAVEALARAARHATGLKPIETKVRDLFREPLSAKELEPFDAVVFDPPRAGARSQVEAIARSKAKVVAAVSCNPATLARDLRTLAEAGYAIERVVPIDQFVYSADVEVVAVLRRRAP